jgi:ribosomal protein S18 acetylase RimI-like enzyme
MEGSCVCAIVDGASIGFSVFQMYEDGGEIHIVEVHPSFRGHRIAGQLLDATVERLRSLGAHYADVECTSSAGEALCRRHSFEDYVDPDNYRDESDDQKLRRYFSDWRPPVRPPWN